MTPSQYQALEDIARSGDPWARVKGQAQHGGWAGVIHAIQREGWARRDAHEWSVTEAGKAAMRQYEEKRKKR